MPAAQAQVDSSASLNAAFDMLVSMLKSIPGVRVTRRPASPVEEPTFEVAIENGNIDAEMAIYRANRDVYDRFPEARFEVDVV